MLNRREFLKKSAYVPPIILSFNAAPSFAKPGSVNPYVATLSGNKAKENISSPPNSVYGGSRPSLTPLEFPENVGRQSKKDVDHRSGLEIALQNIWEELRLFFMRNKT